MRHSRQVVLQKKTEFLKNTDESEPDLVPGEWGSEEMSGESGRLMRCSLEYAVTFKLLGTDRRTAAGYGM